MPGCELDVLGSLAVAKVPLVLPWSSITQPVPSKAMVACRQETLASSNATSDCGSRPIV